MESYLRVNGYFTVTEYPLVEASKYGGYRTATDLDILAFRFPGAGKLASMKSQPATTGGSVISYVPDPALGCDPQQADMLIGEVKEGRAELNSAAHDPAVLQAALTRFGCCGADPVGMVVEALPQSRTYANPFWAHSSTRRVRLNPRAARHKGNQNGVAWACAEISPGFRA